MSYRLIKREVSNYINLPAGAYYVKTKNGKFIIEHFVGKCTC